MILKEEAMKKGSVKVKTSALTGAALDWAVAQLEGEGAIKRWNFNNYKPSLAWEQGGPIIERERIESHWHIPLEMWAAQHDVNLRYGPTPLIAAMRCYVASKLGEEVEVPVELL